MSEKSKNSSRKPKRKTKAEISKPFDPKLWAKARKIAETYTLIVRPDPDPDVVYFGRTLEMPYVMADGPTREACIEQVLEASTLAVAVELEAGRRPIPAASDTKRSAQLNIRLTQGEKFLIEEAAQRDGYRGVSDFVRSAALDKVG